LCNQSEIEEACGGYDNVHVDDPPSDQEAAQFVAKFSKDVSVSGKKHYLNLPDYSASKFAKVPESSSAGDVPAFYYDVYHRNTKDSNTFYEAFLRKDETERQDRLTKEKAERDERLRKEAQDKKENDEMREMLKNRIAELKEEKDQMNEMFKARIAELKDEKQELKDDVKRFFGVLEENKVLKQSLSDKESRLTSTQAQLRTATSDLNEQKGFYRELERDLLHVKQERDDLHASLVTYEDRPLGLPNKLIARGVM
jgi:myosin heavy subunit